MPESYKDNCMFYVKRRKQAIHFLVGGVRGGALGMRCVGGNILFCEEK